MSYVEKVLIDNSYRSDHSGVIPFLKLNTIQLLVNAIKSLLSSTDTIKETPTHVQTPVLPFEMKIILSTNKI